LLPELFSVKVKVLGGGFNLWLGDNISILSMVKRAHLLFLTRGTLDGVPFDTVSCMDAKKSLLLYYSLKIPLLGALLNYGTNTMLRNGTPSPPSGPIFKIA
jgi:hypothetical protein